VLGDVVGLPQRGCELQHLRAERIARRHDAHRLAIAHDRHMTEPALEHEVQRMTEGLVGRDRDRMRRHDLGQRRVVGVEPAREDAKQRVTLRENAHEPVVLDHKHRADVLAEHRCRRFAHVHGASRGDELAAVNHVFDGSHRHGTSFTANGAPPARTHVPAAMPLAYAFDAVSACRCAP